MPPEQHFWNITSQQLMQQLGSSNSGLTEEEAALRLKKQRAGKRIYSPWRKDLLLLFSQFKNPLVLLLVGAVLLSLLLGEYSDSFIILIVLSSTGILGFYQERNAGRAVEKLRELVHNKAAVKRDGVEKEIFFDEVVPGDIVLLNAGDIIPADALILEENDLHANESVLTGESFPVEKNSGIFEATVLSQASNAVFKGTSVINGTASVLVVYTSDDTELGKIAISLEKAVTITSFEKGVQKFGYLLMRLTIVFTTLILVFNLALHRPFIDSLLFSLALTLGLTPELLPAIMTITFSAGARRMAGKKVIVKKLSAVQDLGAINILCCDKTGTITEGIVHLEDSMDATGQPSEKLKLYAYLNAAYETGFFNPIDEAIREELKCDITAFTKYDEVPYDFTRKRLSVVAGVEGRHIMITKGAVQNIMEVCTEVETSEGIKNVSQLQASINREFEERSSQGFRIIALCYKDVTGDPVINKDDEQDMTFLGFLFFSDPPKKGIIESINELRKTGIALKIITGDNHLVASYLAGRIGLSITQVITGSQLEKMSEDELLKKTDAVDVFAEILPAQKEQVVKALQKSGHAVGYLGDGINDANALKAADVGISISNAVDVAKEAADLVLLDPDLDAIRDGVIEGRKTFMNTLKYVFVTTSANFGNMFSMAIASLILPFLPLLPIQILLNNFLSDLPAISIASDYVDEELVQEPRKWDMKFIWRFMIIFGLESSLFDFATFGLLVYVFHAAPEEFRTAWFMESLLTEILILLIIRTRRPFFKSRPSKYLWMAALFTFMASVTIPYIPFMSVFSLYPLPWHLFISIFGVIALYVITAEFSKKYLIGKL